MMLQGLVQATSTRPLYHSPFALMIGMNVAMAIAVVNALYNRDRFCNGGMGAMNNGKQFTCESLIVSILVIARRKLSRLFVVKM